MEQLTLADALKADGMARADAGTDDWWRSCCDRAIRQAATTGRPFQAWDLTEWYGLPEPRHPNQWGPRLSAAAKQGVIVAAGWAESKRPTTAKSAVRTWVGVAAESAA